LGLATSGKMLMGAEGNILIKKDLNVDDLGVKIGQ